MGSVSHVHPAARAVLDRSEAERVAWMRTDRWIGSCTSTLRIIRSVRESGTIPRFTTERGGCVMIPHLFFYQLAVLGLLWLCVMLHAAWPSRCMTAQGTLAKPILPRRQRSTEPTPFAGLTPKPHCALGEHEATPPKLLPPVPPEPMPPTHRRPRTVDTARHFCPSAGCRYRGWLGLGNLRANGHPPGGPWRQLQCTARTGYVLETH